MAEGSWVGCRHSYAAYMIAAGVNTKALSTYMGHSSITITLDRYGHLLPGNEVDPRASALHHRGARLHANRARHVIRRDLLGGLIHEYEPSAA